MPWPLGGQRGLELADVLGPGKREVLAALAASYGHGLCRGHPFVDGNKRIALAAIDVFLQLNGWELVAVEPEACPSLTRGELRYDHGDSAGLTPLLGIPVAVLLVNLNPRNMLLGSRDWGGWSLPVYLLFFVYGFVGTQMAWTLRPFFGAPEYPFQIFRQLGGNFYVNVVEAIWEILTSIG